MYKVNNERWTDGFVRFQNAVIDVSNLIEAHECTSGAYHRQVMTRWWPRNKCWSLLVCTEEGCTLVCSANPPSFINLLVIGIEIPENYCITLFSPLLLINTFHSSLLISESFQIIRSPDLNEAVVWCKGCGACCCKTKIFPS